uniref:MobA/MobL protein n=1 Tax=Magnetospirillum gryphiswaldense TaxID=55518 RepID=A4U3H5_9PROT|nr:MobA/MobL protein [Magnetospirillum gryphiswaldense MSR-1]
MDHGIACLRCGARFVDAHVQQKLSTNDSRLAISLEWLTWGRSGASPAIHRSTDPEIAPIKGRWGAFRQSGQGPIARASPLRRVDPGVRMAIYFFSVRPLAAGKIGPALAYQTRQPLRLNGETFRPSKTGGLAAEGVIWPPGVSGDLIVGGRDALWAAVLDGERVRKRGPRQGDIRRRAVAGRTAIAALPHELSSLQRQTLVEDFGRAMADRYGCAIDFAIHAPDDAGDQRNHHAHIALTERIIRGDGTGPKIRAFGGRDRAEELRRIRQAWEDCCNHHLARAGVAERIDARSLAAQGIGRRPTRHRGPGQTAIARKRPVVSWAVAMEPHDRQAMRQDARAAILALARAVRLANVEASRLAAWKVLVANCRDAVRMGLAQGDALDLAKWAQRTEAAAACPKTSARSSGARLGRHVGQVLAEAAKPIRDARTGRIEAEEDPADELDPILTALTAAHGAVRRLHRQRAR